MTPLVDEIRAISQVPDLNVRLNQLHSFCDKHYFSLAQSKSEVVRCINELINDIEFQILVAAKASLPSVKKLEANALELVQISKVFHQHCGQGDRQAKELENGTVGWYSGLHDQTQALLREALLRILPSDVSRCSVSELLNFEAQIKELMELCDVNDLELQKLCWQEYNRLLPVLQSRKFECSSPSDPVPTQSLNHPLEATSIFALMNLGALDPMDQMGNEQPLIKNSLLTLSFMIRSLEMALRESVFPEEDKVKMARLLNSYQAAYRIAEFQMRELDEASTTGTVEAYTQAKKNVKAHILENLVAQKEIVLSTGYATKPAGHEVALRLILEERDGVRYVRGEVINRGEGVSLHGVECVQGLRERVMPFLQLEGVPLTELEKSPFLELLTELKITGMPQGLHTFTKQETAYAIQDFYLAVLMQWPGTFSEQAREQMVQGAQRGGTCTLKAYWTPFEDLFSSKPEVIRYFKLRMRIDALQFYLNHGRLSSASIPHLKWSLKKMHRTLEKLEKQATLSGNYPEWLKKNLPHEARFCMILTQAVEARMLELQEQSVQTLAQQRQKIAKDPSVAGFDKASFNPLDPLKASVSSLKLTPPKSSFTTAAEACSYAKQLSDFCQVAKARNSAKQDQFLYAQCVAQFLDALPLASNQAVWQSDEWLSVGPQVMMTFIEDRLQSMKNASGFFQPTGRELASIANVVVGLLHALKQSGEFDDALIDDRAGRILGILSAMASQVRIAHPLWNEKMGVAIEQVGQLCGNQAILPTLAQRRSLIGGTDYCVESVPCGTVEERLQDPVCCQIVKQTQDQQWTKSEVQRIKEYMDSRGPLQKSPLPSLLALHQPLLVLGVCGNVKEWYFRQGHTGGGSTDERLKAREVVLPTPLLDREGSAEGLIDPFYGTLTGILFPWSQEERTLVQEWLDPRLPFRGQPRKTQNEQVKVSRRGLSFGKKTLSAQQVEQLLSITATPKSLLPQCMHVFSAKQSFDLLRDPRFQALFQGFLLTRTETGEETLLEKSLRESGPTLGIQFVEFLKEGMKKSTKEKWLEVRLFHLFLLAQVLAHLDKNTSGEVAAKATQALQDEIVLLQKEELGPADQNLVNHWLVALYPLVSENDALKEASRRACERLGQAYAPYDFDGRLLIKECFQAGIASLSQGDIAPKGQVPPWVLEHPEYKSVCQDAAPRSKWIQDNLFEITTKQNKTFRIELLGFAFKISQELTGSDGRKRWCFYQPSLPSGLPLCQENRSCWVSEETPPEAFIVSAKTDKLLYSVREQRIRHPTNGELVLASSTAADIPLVQRFMAMEDKGHVLVWKNEGTSQIESIDIPRLNLSFERQLDPTTQSVEWNSPQYPGFKLDLGTVVPDLEPLSHYLVIQKGQEKRVLVSNRMVEAEKLSLQADRILTTRSATPFQTFCFVLDSDGRLEPPKEAESLLYLIHLTLRSYHYEEARRWIDRLEEKLPAQWGEKEKALVELGWLEPAASERDWSVDKHQEQDMHPFACALRVRLRLLAQRAFPEGRKPNLVKSAMTKDYANCLEHINSLGEAWLSPRDEREAIKHAVSRIGINESILSARQEQLREEPPPLSHMVPTAFSLPPGRGRKDYHFRASRLEFQDRLSDPSKWLTPEIEKAMVKHSQDPLPIALSTRPGDAFILNFLYYYRIAYTQKPPEALLELKNLLLLSMNGTDPTVEWFRYFLQVVIDGAPYRLENTRKFLDPEELLKLCNSPGELLSYFDKIRFKDGTSLFETAKLTKASTDRSQLQPKKGIVTLAPTRSPEQPTLDLDPERVPPASTETLVKKGLIIEQSPTEQRQGIQQDIEAFQQLSQVCQEEGSRMLEGIQERLGELEKQLKNPPTSYRLPVVVAASQSQDQQKSATEKLGETGDWLAEQIDASTAQVKALEQQVLAAANTRSEASWRQVHAGLVQPIGEIRTLLIAFARGDDQRIKKANPELTAQGLKELKELLKRYAIARTEQQHVLRSQVLYTKAIDTANQQPDGWASAAAKNAAEAFVTTLTQPRSFDLNKHPDLLLLEAIGDIRLREDQCEVLIKLTSGSDQDFDLEARTGFGKSKVIVPIWLFLNRKPGQLTLFVTTKSLIKDSLVHLKELLGEDFDVAIKEIPFDRSKASDTRDVAWVNEQFEAAKCEGRVILMDIGSLHGCSGLALKQELLRDPSARKMSKEAIQLLATRKHLQEAFIFIDESAECLGIRELHEYASGKPKPVDPKHSQMATSSYQSVLLSPDILSKWKLPFLPDSPSGQVITQDNYPQVRADLADAVIQYLNIPPDDREAVKNHLMGVRTEGVETYLESLTLEQQGSYVASRRGMLEMNLEKRAKAADELIERLQVPEKFRPFVAADLMNLTGRRVKPYLEGLQPDQRKLYDDLRSAAHAHPTLAAREEAASEALESLDVPIKYRQAVMTDFMGIPQGGVKAYLASLPEDQQRLYGYCYQQLERHLKISLVRRHGVRYQTDPSRLAIPLREGAPRPNCEFSKLDHLINFTIQANLKEPFDAQTIERIVEELQQIDLTQNRNVLQAHPSYSPILGIAKELGLDSIKKITPKQYQEIADYLNANDNQELRLKVIEGSILPKIRTLPYKISGNSYTLLRSIGQVHAASGTPNPDVLPLRMTSLQKKSALTGNLLALWKNSNPEVFISDAQDPEERLKQFLESRSEERVLVDIGGTFSDLPQKKIVNTIFDKIDVKGVTFYDNQGHCMLWLRGADAPIPREASTLSEDEIFVYIRQANAIGSDTPMAQSARGDNTVSRDTTETLFLQGVGRMRGLQTGQIANFVVTKEDATVIRRRLSLPETTPITLSHLLRYVQKMEIEQNQKDYLFALGAHLKEQIEGQIWSLWKTGKISQDQLQILFGTMKNFLVETTEEDVMQGLFKEARMITREEAVTRLKTAILQPLESFLKKQDPLVRETMNLQAIEKEFNDFLKLNKLAPEISMADSGAEEEVSETEKEVSETSHESEIAVEQEVSTAASSFKPAKPTPWDGDYHAAFGGKKQDTILGIHLYQSPNLPVLERGRELEAVRKPAYQVVLKVEKSGQLSLLTVDLHDMSCVLEKMKTNSAEESGYYLLGNGRILAAEKGQEALNLQEVVKEPGDRARLMIVTKLLAGGTSLSKTEFDWIRTELTKETAKGEKQKFLMFIANGTEAWPKQASLFDQVEHCLQGKSVARTPVRVRRPRPPTPPPRPPTPPLPSLSLPPPPPSSVKQPEQPKPVIDANMIRNTLADCDWQASNAEKQAIVDFLNNQPEIYKDLRELRNHDKRRALDEILLAYYQENEALIGQLLDGCQWQAPNPEKRQAAIAYLKRSPDVLESFRRDSDEDKRAILDNYVKW